MAGLIAERLIGEGYEIEQSLDAALPMPVWSLDLEVERHRETSAAELAVLRLVEAGAGEPSELTRRMGLEGDGRLTEQVLVRLLGGLAVEPKGDRFILTGTGRAWIDEGGARGRERLAFEVRHDPVHDAFEWVDSERPVFASDQTWTIELPAVDDTVILGRKPEITRLVRDHGLPDELDEAPHARRPPVDLRSFALAGRRVHWRAVRIDVWTQSRQADARLVAYLGDAENSALSSLLASFALSRDRRRVVPR